MKRFTLALLAVMAAGLCGCLSTTSTTVTKYDIGADGRTNAVTISKTNTSVPVQAGCITTVKERVIGFMVAQSASTQSPEIRFGFTSTVIQRIPVSTNEIHSPNFRDNFTFGNDFPPLEINIQEDTATGAGVLSSTNNPARLSVPLPLGATISAPIPTK